MRILINAANLHSGGALQVASSVIFELSNIFKGNLINNIHVIASSKVNASLVDLGFDPLSFCGYEVFDVSATECLNPDVRKRFSGYDAVFTIFGPMYFLTKLNNHLVGFAQPWIIYPDSLLKRKLPLFLWVVYRIKYEMQWIFFRRSHHLVVELEHVKKRLVEIRNYPASKISVIENCISPIFEETNLWQEVESQLFKEDRDVLKLGYLCRDYPHKNVDFLADVAAELKRISTRKYQFYVTLSDDEWGKKSDFFKKIIKNIGEIKVAQCPKFYLQLDATIFPSLLECYSATPIESFAMKVPVFVSDLDFLHDCCHEHAIYFDPLDPASAASVIESWFVEKSVKDRKAHVESAFNYFCTLHSAKERAKSYLALIQNFAKNKGC